MSLIFIGNYKRWVDENWIEKVLSNKGQARPKDWPAACDIESNEYTKSLKAGYNLNDILWWVYEKKDLNIDIDPPWCKGKIHWWITKLNPGQFMPMHVDPDTFEFNSNRYWVPLTDYETGHIFVYKDSVILNYKAGDVYSYEKNTDVHGAANIGFKPRIVLQVTEYLD